MITMITKANTRASVCGRKFKIVAKSPYILAPMNIPITTPSIENISVSAPRRRPETVVPMMKTSNTISSINEDIEQ